LPGQLINRLHWWSFFLLRPPSFPLSFQAWNMVKGPPGLMLLPPQKKSYPSNPIPTSSLGRGHKH
jgi:hypothetical protein